MFEYTSLIRFYSYQELRHNETLHQSNAFINLLSRVAEAVKWLDKFNASHIPVASVATGFPSGQYSLETRLEEIRYAVKAGAKEIDIVINRTLALQVSYLI